MPGSYSLSASIGQEMIGILDVQVKSAERHVIGESIGFEVWSTDSHMMDAIVSTPILFSLTLRKDLQKALKESTTRKTKHHGSNTGKIATEVIGQANFDIFPIILGEPKVEEVLILEIPEELGPDNSFSETLLPRLCVVASDPAEFFSIYAPKPKNIITVTVEGVFNLDRTVMDAEASYVVATPFPRQGTPKEMRDRQLQMLEKAKMPYQKVEGNFSLFQFHGGIFMTCPDLDRRKKWSTLAYVEGGPARSKYRISSEPWDAVNPMHLDLEAKMYSMNEPRVLWNTVRRGWLSDTEELCFMQTLLETRVWPFELIVTKQLSKKIGSMIDSTTPPPGKGKSEGKKGTPKSNSLSYIVWVDLSTLLYPGVRRARVVGHLQLFNPNEGILRWALESTFMAPPAPPNFYPEEVIDYLKSRKKRTFSKFETYYGTEEKEKERPSTTQVEPGEEKENKEKARENMIQKLYGQDKNPMFIVVEVELMNPLNPKTPLEEIEANVKELLPNREDFIPPEMCKKKEAQTGFHMCLANLTALITKEYEDFRKIYTGTTNPLSGEMEEKFYDYIERSRAHQIITESLVTSMTAYVVDALGSPLAEKELGQQQLKDYVGWLYCRLVDEMQSIVNTFVVEGESTLSVQSSPPLISDDDLYLFAIEAVEQGDYEKAQQYLTKRLEGDGMRNPQYWIDYGSIAMRMGDKTRTLECVKEALALDVRNKEALMMYAVLLALNSQFKEAELFFSALGEFHPTFAEGWILFHMFYLLVENTEGADFTLILGIKCSHENADAQTYRPPQLSWDETFIPKEENMYLKAAVYLLTFNLYEFAEICLAQELDRTKKKSQYYVYYLAVCHHVQGRYRDSNNHLVKAIVQAFKLNTDPRFYVLIGNNYWKMGKIDKAVKVYQKSFSTVKEAEGVHIPYIRCGYYLLEQKKPRRARQMFLRAVKAKGTPLGWLGLGISLYMLNNMEDAELALTEANTLDNTQATVWGYLGLVTLHKNKKDQFQQCMHEAKKFGLKDAKLLKKIDEISKNFLCREEYIGSIEQPEVYCYLGHGSSMTMEDIDGGLIPEMKDGSNEESMNLEGEYEEEEEISEEGNDEFLVDIIDSGSETSI